MSIDSIKPHIQDPLSPIYTRNPQELIDYGLDYTSNQSFCCSDLDITIQNRKNEINEFHKNNPIKESVIQMKDIDEITRNEQATIECREINKSSFKYSKENKLTKQVHWNNKINTQTIARNEKVSRFTNDIQPSTDSKQCDSKHINSWK